MTDQEGGSTNGVKAGRSIQDGIDFSTSYRKVEAGSPGGKTHHITFL